MSRPPQPAANGDLAAATVRLQLNMGQASSYASAQRQRIPRPPLDDDDDGEQPQGHLVRSVQSPLGDGRWGLFERMKQSSFGKFQQVLEELEGAIPVKEFTLPVVVVIGDESVGKSSLLENITKCALFPRDEETCTRCPVRLQLTRVSTEAERSIEVLGDTFRWELKEPEDILETVKEEMHKLRDANKISETEVVIKMKRENVPTFECVDLPGLRGVPPHDKMITKLVKKYLRQPNTVVLCVMQATIPTIVSSVALGLVLKLNKECDTILALTKVDEVKDECFYKQVVKRLDGTSAEYNVDGRRIRLAGCVAIKNRRHDDDEYVTLQRADAKEAEWWNRKFETLSATDKDNIKRNVTVLQLVRQIDNLYHKCICNQWKPQALDRLAPMIRDAETEVMDLGPEFVTARDIVSDIKERLQQFWPNVVTPALEDSVSLNAPYGSRNWARNRFYTKERITYWAKCFLRGEPYLQEILTAVSAAFDNRTPLRTERFDEVRGCVVAIIQSQYEQMMSKWYSRVEDRLLGEMAQMIKVGLYDYYQQGANSLGDALLQQRIKSSVQGYVVTQMCLPLLEAEFLLTEESIARLPLPQESPEWHARRTEREDRLQRLHGAREVISTIEDAVAS